MLDFLNSDSPERERTYPIVIEQDDDGSFVATSPALPGYVAYAGSESAATRKLHRAIRRSLDGFAEDYRARSRVDADATSRHKARLHFRTPLTPAAKLVLAATAAVGLYVVLKASSDRSD